MHSFSLITLFGSLLPLVATAANLANWEGPHNDPSTTNTQIDWWYTQVIGQTPASNGVPPSIEVTLKHGNPFQFGANSPLYAVDINGFDSDGQPFANTLTFNASSVSVAPDRNTIGIWGNNEAVFSSSPDHRNFNITFNTNWAKGTIVINSEAGSEPRTGCGGTTNDASPFFNSLVQDGRSLTPAEKILFYQTGWRVSIFGGPSTVDLVLGGESVKFTGFGYKDSNWAPASLNSFVNSWFLGITQVGPYSFTTFSGGANTGKNLINAGHLIKNGKFLTSQCGIIGEKQRDISIIRPFGDVNSAGVIAPLGMTFTFVLEDNVNITFTATNIQENPSVSIYHRWIAKYTGGAEGESFSSYGIVEWMNAANNSQWVPIQ